MTATKMLTLTGNFSLIMNKVKPTKYFYLFEISTIYRVAQKINHNQMIKKSYLIALNPANEI